MRRRLRELRNIMELLSNHKIAEHYDFEKNEGTADFDTLTTGSNKKVWWKCELGHSWEASVKKQNKKES